MSAKPELLLQKLKTLPPQRLAEVEDFVDFLKSRDEQARTAAGQRLGEAMARVDAIVSGDAGLRTLESIQGIPILSANQILDKVG